MSDGFPPLVARCPAKINLLLRVVARRPDGYHELDTVFQAIDLWDELRLRWDAGLTLSCDDSGVPVDGRNLVLRAARRLAECARVPAHGAFVLRKGIPVQGGLGGGSSDAAAALLLCARAWGLEWSAARLMRVAREIGADVPFFLVGGTARGRGRGDRIAPLTPVAETALLLGCPPFGCPTVEVFAEVSRRLTLPGFGVRLPRRFSHKWREEKDFALAANDLERIVFDRWPELERFRDGLLAAGAIRSMLCGSGSTVFGAFGDATARDAAAERLRAGFTGWALVGACTVRDGIAVAESP